MLPRTVRWRFASHDGFTANVQRSGFPIFPERTCSLYSLQGTTADPGLIAFFDMQMFGFSSKNVLLSRVRQLSSLLSVSLKDSIREVIESGPPAGLVGEFDRIVKTKLGKTKQKAYVGASNMSSLIRLLDFRILDTGNHVGELLGCKEGVTQSLAESVSVDGELCLYLSDAQHGAAPLGISLCPCEELEKTNSHSCTSGHIVV